MRISNRCRRLAFLTLVIVSFAFVLGTLACESVRVEIEFKNELNRTVNVYFSRSDDDDWSEKPTRFNVKSGSQIGLMFSDFDGSSGKKTDIGAIDEQLVNYDVYDVVIEEGDVVTLRGSESGAEFVITHLDGTETVLSAVIYSPKSNPQ